jgi:para-aminobenzoate synthetase/4-amino-4-deoxychorismate lyase
LASTKNRAENLMIVDLLRNDLHRVCEPGTVKVTDLFATEAYPTVWQLTSTVTGLTRPGVGLVEVFTALFPCGSITGAPKASTMRVITALETSPRGVYCGAIGLLTPTRTTFNVAIRSVVLDRDTGIAEYGVGGGITWDSTAEDEYDEVLAKAAVLGTRRPAFGLIETISLRDGQYTLLPEHLTRLADSAAYFGIPVVLSQILDALDTASAEAGAGSWRVRLVVDEQGLPQVQVAALAGAPVDTGGPPPPGSRPPLRGALAGEPVDERSIWLFHKTTNRRVYDAQRAAHPAADDVLLVNRAGELTEWTVGNLVVELDGALVTPPVRCGLLPGTLRARLFADGVISARVLTPEDLHRVSGIWLINGVRGWVPMTLDVTDNVTSTVV